MKNISAAYPDALSTPIAGCVENGDGPAVDVSAEDLTYSKRILMTS